MPIRVKCEQCKKTLSVKDHLAGKRIKCPLCQSVLGVPLASPTKEPPAATKESAHAPKKPAPQAAPVSAKKPAVAAKAKPAVAKPASNGSPAGNGAKTNGKTPLPSTPKPIEPPPENVEEEALSALADEPAPPPEETQGPQTVDFKCQWCDEEVKLPIELAGKQAQCPNPECKRIIKVPVPKTDGKKKDWRKMDRQGPAAARINQPEELENAWGTETATRAGSGSLAQAGIGVPVKQPVGVFGWLRRGFYGVCIVTVLLVAGLGLSRLRLSTGQVVAIEDIKALVDGKESKDGKSPKITDPLLKAEAFRTITLYHLHGREPKIKLARKDFQEALAYIKIAEVPPVDAPLLHEQFLAIELALTQVDSGADPDDVLLLEKKRQEWSKTQEDIDAALKNSIRTPELQVIALREIAGRLNQKGKKELAIGLAGGLSGADPATKKRPLAFRQQIALVYWADKLDTLPDVVEPKLGDLKELEVGTGDVRVGFAEGYARKDKYEEAFKLASFPGPEKDRLEAHLGIAAVALQDQKKEKATEALKAALELAKSPGADALPWHWLELVRLGARLDDPAVQEAVADIVKNVQPPPFQLRALLVVFQAQCEKSPTPLPVAALADLEAVSEKERITLALAWVALARQHARTGASRGDMRKTFDNYSRTANLDERAFELIRPMVDIGVYQGMLK